MTNDILAATLLISVLHGIIPGHWLPVLALKKRYDWSASVTLRVAAMAATAHAVSTVLLGILLASISHLAAEKMESYTHWIMPGGLIAMGIFFMYQHHTHHHFHLSHEDDVNNASRRKVVGLLALMMFLSPCLEIEAVFLKAGIEGFYAVGMVALIYGVVSVAGITLWVALAQRGLQRLNWHGIEHNAGLIAGLVLVLVGVASFWMH
jgi:nickel/cobalt transporter (NicO) family protein